MVMLFGLILLINVASAVDVGIGDDEIGIDLSTQSVPNVSNYNVTGAEIWVTDEGDLDDVADISHSWLDDLGWSVSGHFMDTFLDMAGFSIFNVANLNVSGNASFTGTFDTPCLHCEDGDTYFHGDGFFSGNVTAPNIEVMESLIVHGNSTCTGTATACGDIADAGLCGYTIYTGQRGCRWRLFSGDCVGTATPCDEMSTATCEEQHVCSLTSDYGFVFDPSGFSGDFDINTNGSITARLFNGTYNWTSGDDWTDFDGAVLYFNESQLATIYYNATQAQGVEGTVDGGTLVDTQHQDGDYDSRTFNFSEVAGSPGLDFRINFTDVDSFNAGVMRYKTSSLSGNYPVIQLWSYTDLDWHDYPQVSESLSFATIEQPVWDASEHIQDGVVMMRLYKASNGNTNNHYYVDWLAISKGYGTPAGEEVDPFSWHRGEGGEEGNFLTQGNITATNITADYFYGDGSGLTGITSTVAIQLKNNSLASGNTYLLTNTTWNSINSQINNIKVTTECESMNLSICTDSGCTSEDVLYSESYKNASTYGSYTYMNADGKAGVYMKYFCNSGADTSNIYLGGLTA